MEERTSALWAAHVHFYLDNCIVSVYAHGTEVKNGDSAECDVKEVVDLRRLVLVSQLYLPSTDVKMFLLISSARKGLEGVPKKCTIRPKLSAVGTPCVSRHKGCWLLVIESVHCGSNSILKVRFFGTPCRSARCRKYHQEQ